MRAIVAACAALPLLIACSQPAERMATTEAPATAEVAAAAPEEIAAGADVAQVVDGRLAKPAPPGAGPKAGQPAAQAPAPVLPMLAYAYGLKLELPADKARGLLSRHQQACEEAGPALCQVVAATSTAQGRDQAYGQLEIRAQPAWLKAFRKRLTQDAAGAGGKVVSETTETEDLTRQMVDTEASIRTATVMQARLERLLAERPGNLQDALAIEQELARVRGTIDATRSQLEVMRGRVAMSKLTVDYVSRGVAAPDGVASPLVDALEGFLGNVLAVVAVLITALSFLLPLALLAVPVVWWLVRRARRPRAARPPPVNLES